MKKVFVFAAALAVLAACSKDNDQALKAGETVTLNATVGLPACKVAPDDPTASTVNFVWQEGDSVTISNGTESSVFHVDAATIQGGTASFTGTALSDMSSYTVSYGDGSAVAYQAGTFTPIISGTGGGSSFTLNQFRPVLKLQLTGDVTLGKIELWEGDPEQVVTTLGCGAGLQLTTTATTVYFPVNTTLAGGFTLKFYDTDDELVMSKSSSNTTDYSNQIVPTGALEVVAPMPLDPSPNLIQAWFSVSATKKVQFAKCNLYWNGSAYHFESTPIYRQTSWNASHVSHFFWCTPQDIAAGRYPYAQSYSFGSHYTQYSQNDQLFCGENNKMTVDGTSGLYALTQEEFTYLYETRPNAANLRRIEVTVGEVRDCLVIAPDGYKGTIGDSYTLAQVETEHLLVFAPTGHRSYGTEIEIYYANSSGNYWFNSPREEYIWIDPQEPWEAPEEYDGWVAAGDMYLYKVWSGRVDFNAESRGYGYALRLVK